MSALDKQRAKMNRIAIEEAALTLVAVDQNGEFVTDIEEARKVVATAFGQELPLEDEGSADVGMWLVELPKDAPAWGVRTQGGATVTWESAD